MVKHKKIKPNDPCPCLSGKKYKHCCKSEFDWNQFLRDGGDIRERLSVRGKNMQFANRIVEILQLDGPEKIRNLEVYKKAFTKEAVVRIHEAIMEIWPPNTNIQRLLSKFQSDVTGLYIGDYEPKYLTRGIVRHSTYANKILIVDPFVYPWSVRDEFNPILNPEQYRSQTLKNVNFWFSLLPWLDEGIVEIIKTPASFDRKLNRELLNRQQKKFDESEELQEARDISLKEHKERHFERRSYEHLLLSAPNSYLKQVFEELNLGKDGYTVDDYLRHIQAQRDRNADFLEPIGPGSPSGQLHMISSGASYDIAQLTASITNSYLVTDLYVRWREIELDRQNHNAANKVWTPFTKAFQNTPLKYLNEMNLDHALAIRKEGRLKSLRGFLYKVWKNACAEDPYDEANAIHLAEELDEKIREAEVEWDQIDKDIIKIIGTELSAGLLAAGPLIASGHANFMAAAAVTASATTLAASTSRHKHFPDRFPAAFFMKLSND